MASGYIIFKDGRCFARRWTGYDEIIRIAIHELAGTEQGQALANWLSLQIPDSDIDDSGDSGWGFYNPKIDTWVNRELDIRSLTPENQDLFWKAIEKGKVNLIEKGKAYSPLSIDFFHAFYEMYELAEKGEPPMELSDWNKLADPCEQKNGPGWKNS